MARALSDRLTMKAPDMVGHGRAPDHDPDRDFHDQSTVAAAGRLPDSSCHLIGHSFGATVALRLALEHPARIRCLILIEPVLFAAAAPDSAGRQANRAALRNVATALADGDPDSAARIFMGMWGGATPYDDLSDGQKAYMRTRMPLIVASDPALEQDAARLVPRLEQVACPVLLIAGATSPKVIDDIQSRMARDMPRAERVVIDGAGHMMPITHPGETAAAIRGFLEASGA
jgi:pimeloyl-ACP methyl ester carboxylesterase